RRQRSEWPISSTTSNVLSSCATSPSPDRLVLRKSGPLVSIPNSNQAKSTAGVRGSPARGLVDRTLQLQYTSRLKAGVRGNEQVICTDTLTKARRRCGHIRKR